MNSHDELDSTIYVIEENNYDDDDDDDDDDERKLIIDEEYVVVDDDDDDDKEKLSSNHENGKSEVQLPSPSPSPPPFKRIKLCLNLDTKNNTTVNNFDADAVTSMTIANIHNGAPLTVAAATTAVTSTSSYVNSSPSTVTTTTAAAIQQPIATVPLNYCYLCGNFCYHCYYCTFCADYIRIFNNNDDTTTTAIDVATSTAAAATTTTSSEIPTTSTSVGSAAAAAAAARPTSNSNSNKSSKATFKTKPIHIVFTYFCYLAENIAIKYFFKKFNINYEEKKQYLENFFMNNFSESNSSNTATAVVQPSHKLNLTVNRTNTYLKTYVRKNSTFNATLKGIEPVEEIVVSTQPIPQKSEFAQNMFLKFCILSTENEMYKKELSKRNIDLNEIFQKIETSLSKKIFNANTVEDALRIVKNLEEEEEVEANVGRNNDDDCRWNVEDNEIHRLVYDIINQCM